jgi:enoyl-CoA hydratase/carnithine racemase
MAVVRYEDWSEGVRRIVLDDPEHHNVLTLAALGELEAALGEAARDTSLRLLVIVGNGRTFCTGADLAEIDRLRPEQAVPFALRGQAVMDQLAHFPQPTLAAINGLALGGGLELALACDLRWAHRRAFLGFPEIRHGLCPAWGGVSRLEALLPGALGKDLLLRGTPVGAESARALGLVSRVFDSQDFLEDVRAALEALSGPAPLLRAYKSLLGGREKPEASFAALWRMRQANRSSSDSKETS